LRFFISLILVPGMFILGMFHCTCDSIYRYRRV